MVKPILFNTEMVRAILDGRKTVTRRVVKPQPIFAKSVEHDPDGKSFRFACENRLGKWEYQVSPGYRHGDILWVRETWALVPDEVRDPLYRYCYKADEEEILVERWHPSIHMPREAARIWLRVTDVRVERLQEIDGDGLRAEGFDIPYFPNELDNQFNKYGAIFDLEQAKKSFSALWDSTIKPADLDRYGWDANPWVWVIEFERFEKPEEE